MILLGSKKLTVWASVPSVIHRLMQLNRLKEESLPSLKISFFCGEPLTIRAAEAWQRAAPKSILDNHYGPTEATVSCTFKRYEQQKTGTLSRGTLSIGKPYPGVRTAIISEAGEVLESGRPGQLALSGSQLALGYLDQTEATKQKFVERSSPASNEATSDLRRWYLTGDLGYTDPLGEIHLLGRIDRQIKLRGYRIELEEIDAHLWK